MSKKNKRKNSNYKNGMSKKKDVGVYMCSLETSKDFEGLKKAVAYIPGCLGTARLRLIISYLLSRAYAEGYVIEYLFLWDNVFNLGESYTEVEADNLLIKASKYVADFYDLHKENPTPIEAIFTFYDNFDVSVEGFHKLIDYYDGSVLGELIDPDNKKAIYKPYSNELNPGIIPGFWFGRDEDFYDWIDMVVSKSIS